MKQAILGKKVGMTQVFCEDGTMVPVTVVLAGPCPVTQIKTVDHDGYDAVQMAFMPVREKLITKPEMGHLKKAGVEAHRYVKEFRLDDCSQYEVGNVVKADVFEKGDHVDVTGISKGKGFEGNIKRWNQARGRKTHGSHSYRVAGSMGACTYPGEVFKTKHLLCNLFVGLRNLSVPVVLEDAATCDRRFHCPYRAWNLRGKDVQLCADAFPAGRQ